MTRSIDAALLAAMNAGTFTPCFKVQLLDDDRSTVVFETEEVTGFVIDGLEARVQFHDPTFFTNYATFRIFRGAVLAGVKTYLKSCQFYPTIDRHEKRIRSLEGHVFPSVFFSTPGDVTYAEIIETLCTEYGLLHSFEDGAADWLDYQFYPDGRTFTLNNVRQFFTILRQKYLIFAAEYANDILYFYQAKATPPAYPASYTAVHPGLQAFAGVGSYKLKSFLSRDENNTTHTSGDPSSPIHNLGFLPSTADQPDRDFYYDTNDWIIKDIPPNLKYFDFDALACTFDIGTIALYPAKVREVFDKKLSPSWQWQARYLDIFGNTEGGAIPSSIEAAAPYTPLNVTNFNKNLNGSNNNLQSLADKVDELDCGPAIFADTAKAVPDDADLFPLVDSDTGTHLVRNIQWSDIKAELKIVNDAYYQLLSTVERETLVADRTYHVRTDGNDANTGLVDSAGGAFLTVQKACDIASTLDLNHYVLTIMIHAGTYSGFVLRDVVGYWGPGAVHIRGSSISNPENVVISAAGNCIMATSITTMWLVEHMKVTSSAATGLFVSDAFVTINNLVFGACAGFQIQAAAYGHIGCSTSYKIIGAAYAHICSYSTSLVELAGATVTFQASLAFGVFVYIGVLSSIICSSVTWTMGGFSVTGSRYAGFLNSVINTNGGGAAYFPGDAVGSLATGAQYA